jgi:diadenylate cyclase
MIEELGTNILDFTVVDFIDIVLVGIIIYQIYKLIRGTIAINIFLGFLLMYVLWIIVKAFNMQLLSTILDKFLGLGFIAIIVLFQQEIRKFLLLLGRNTSVSNSYFKRLFKTNNNSLATQESTKALADAILELSSNKVGALIVFINGYDEETFQNN